MLEKIAYRGWQNAYRMSNGTVELIVLADVGPRIISYGFVGSENQLHEVTDHAGLSGGTKFRLYGGHRLWVSPEDASTYYPDNHTVSVSQPGDSVCFSAPVESNPPGKGLQKDLEIRLAPHDSRVLLTHRITNASATAIELAPWAPTMMRGGGRAVLPLAPRAAMDDEHLLPVSQFAIWSYTDFSDPRWSFGSEYIQLRHDSSPKGRFKEQMGGIYNPCEWAAYHRDHFLFVKQARVVAGGRYPDFGCNFELFTNLDFLELETLGPMTELQPGESTVHEETWTLFRDVPKGNDEDWIRSTVLPRTKLT
jgi:hypothetical protein